MFVQPKAAWETRELGVSFVSKDDELVLCN